VFPERGLLVERISQEDKLRFRDALRRIPPDERAEISDWMRRLIDE